MIQFGERLRSDTGRRRIPDSLRTQLMAAGDGIKNHLQALRRTLKCPQDALGG